MNDPPRTADDPAAPRALARLVSGARADGPTEAELAALTAAVRARIGSGPPGGGGASAPRPHPRWLARALPSAAVLGTAALLLARVERPAPRAPAVVVRAPAPPPPAALPTPAPTALRPTPAEAPAPPPPAPRAAAPAPSPCDPDAHLRAVESARRTLREGAPQASLTVVARDRRNCPRGPLAEERDRVEIESLLALNRRADAARHLARFAQEHPGSLHLLDLRARMDSGVASAVRSRP